MKRKVGQDIIMRKKTNPTAMQGSLPVQKPIQPIVPRPVVSRHEQSPQRQPERVIQQRSVEPREHDTSEKKSGGSVLGNLFKKRTPVVSVRNPEIVRERFQESLPPARGGLMWMLVGIACIVLIATIFSIIARARININLKEARYPVDVSVVLYEEPAENQVGYKTATVSDKQSAIVPTTRRDNSGGFAQGTIKLFSTASTTITLPAKTVITGSTGKKFTLDKKISLPAGSVKKPSSTDVTITASESGDTYNVGRDDFTLEKYPAVIGHSVNDISGGSATGNFVLSAEELKTAQQQLSEQIKLRDPSVYLSKQIPKNFLLLNTLTQTSEITFSSASVDTGVQVTAERAITGNMIDQKSLQQLLRYTAIPESEQSYMNPTDISAVGIALENTAVTAAPSAALENKTLNVHATGSFIARAEFNQADILTKIVHKRKKDAKKILENIPGITNVSITMWPPWIGKIPNRSSAITVLTSFGISS